MISIIIKKVSTEELKILQNIGRETFYETFAKDNP